MKRLAGADIRTILEFLRGLYTMRGLDAFSVHVIRTLPSVVASDTTTYNEVNLRQGRSHSIAEPTGSLSPALLEIFQRYLSEHPLIIHYARTSDGSARKISDFLTREEFRRRALYNEFFRVAGLECQMAFTSGGPPRLLVGIALNRGRRDFTERDRAILDLLRPHVLQAYRNAEALTRIERDLTLIAKGQDTMGCGVVLFDTGGHVRYATSRARRWLAEYFGRARGDVLPDALWRWVRREGGALTDSADMPPPRGPLIVEREGQRLAVRLLSKGDDGVLLLAERIEPTPQVLEALGVSRREAEVLHWLAQGKTNADIAAILGAKPRTIGKHLEHIYAKLGVETRTAAASAVLAFISDGGSGVDAYPPA